MILEASASLWLQHTCTQRMLHDLLFWMAAPLLFSRASRDSGREENGESAEELNFRSLLIHFAVRICSDSWRFLDNDIFSDHVFKNRAVPNLKFERQFDHSNGFNSIITLFLSA